MENQILRQKAREFFDIGVKAADPALAVRAELTAQPIAAIKDCLHIIAIGKAAIPMIAEALHHVPKGTVVQATAVTNYENARNVDNVMVFSAGHPVPDENGLAAGRYITKQLSGVTQDDFVLCLISGGGSALLPVPVSGISLEDKIQTNAQLLASGLDIEKMNLVRQNLSMFKGGGLAALCQPAKVRSLIISDVIGDDPRVIASGPTANKIGSKQQARHILESVGVWDDIPDKVRLHLSSTEINNAAQAVNAENTIIASNRQSLEAIFETAAEWNPIIVNTQLNGNVADAAHEIVDFITHHPQGGPQLLIWGGETTVKLQGTGKGGRNQELALRVALEGHMISGDWLFLSGGTDGRDGPTDVAGGIVDTSSIASMVQANVDLAKTLANNDSYHALKRIDNLLTTGATGTNVADIQLFLRC